MVRPLLDPVQPGDHLTPDELAARAGDEFLAGAVLEQQLRAQRQAPVRRGVCLNCDQSCHPQAVYCDAECRADHEARSAAAQRTGGAA